MSLSEKAYLSPKCVHELSVKEEIVLCPDCKGFGVFEDMGDLYCNAPIICSKCDGHGRLLKRIDGSKITYELLEDISRYRP